MSTKKRKSEVADDEKIRHKVCTVTLIDGVMKDEKESEDARDRKVHVKHELTCKSLRFMDQELKVISDPYDAHSNNPSRTNRLLHRQGVDQSKLLSNQVPYKMLKLVSKFKTAVMQEIEAQGIQIVSDNDKKWWGS